MSQRHNKCGGASVNWIITFFVSLILLYEGIKFGPLVIAQFQFQDAVLEATKFSHGKEAVLVREELMTRARELQLPITSDMIKVDRKPTHTRIIVNYVLKSEWLPGWLFGWAVNVDEESVLF